MQELDLPVKYLILVLGEVFSSNRTEYPTLSPSVEFISELTRLAAVIAACIRSQIRCL